MTRKLARASANAENGIVASGLEDVAGRLSATELSAAPHGPIDTLNRYLFEDQGFAGNTANYDDPRNSFLNQVLERRTGIPITLALVYIEVARRAHPLMVENGGTLLTLTYMGSNRVTPNYNVMGIAKAALEASVRYLANDLGPEGIRVHAISPGPMKTLAGVAHGLSRTLIERAADVMLKERRPLVLVPRETPMSLPQLRNMVASAEAGALVLPAMPAFYQGPRTLDDLADFMAGKILGALGFSHELYPPWTG